MKKKQILIGYQLPKSFFKSLEDHFDLKFPTGKSFSEEELITLLPESDGMIAVFGNKVPDKAIENNKRTRIISNFGAGYDNINTKMAAQFGISVTNTPDEVSEPTAELAMALILGLSRGIPLADREIRAQQESWGVMENLGSSLSGKKLGIIGMGKIGKAIARKAKAFNMELSYYQRSPLNSASELNYQANYKTFNELLSQSDIISLSLPLNKGTHHLIGEKELDLMSAHTLLINTSRGAIIDENALVESLQKKGIAGAALDVFENEPKIHPELKKMNQVILVPHIGTATIETRKAMAEKACQNIIDFFEGKALKNLVNAI